MSLIYLVFSATGAYEDYRETAERAFKDKEKADEYCKYLDKKFDYKPVFDEDTWDKVLEELNEFYDSSDFTNEFSYKDEKDKWEARDREISKLIAKTQCDLLRKNGYPNATEEEVVQHSLYEDYKYEERHKCFVVSVDLEE